MIKALFEGLGLKQYFIIALAIAVVGLVLVARNDWIDRGASQATDKIQKANDKAATGADDAENRVKACGVRGWDQGAGKCAQ